MKIIVVDSKTEAFIMGLSGAEGMKVFRVIEHLKRFGNMIVSPYSKKISGDLFELRTSGRNKIRILYAFRQDGAVLLHCFIKKTQKTPIKEIEIALQKLWLYDNI